ncbi:callose synthase [Thraustotheca clavata]|uniref:1,3-beta-glucan synthase n=1 Tax=Thraustotheca clavata TaxID=74557 RepID=A0A1V9ZR35_9STRA|nr:callose synthase [Thraustotheca clavata]
MRRQVGQQHLLRQQQQWYEEGMALVNAAVQLQNAGDIEGADRHFTQVTDVFERALAIPYKSQDDADAAARLNGKMARYVNMIKAQRAKIPSMASQRKLAFRNNILDMDELPLLYHPVARKFVSNGDLFEQVKHTLGFQEHNAANQREHLLLLLTNFIERMDKRPNSLEPMDSATETALVTGAIKSFHSKLFDNYKKWAKYLGTKAQFSNEPLLDIILFFLIWGEAGNFRQTPELLCFLYHSLAPALRSNQTKEVGDFLVHVIRPMYCAVRKDNDKKTVKGARAPHTEIRNYDDFNEFFWTKKCLKSNAYNIGETFAKCNKKGDPTIVKKTFKEHRSWFRALLSFRRIFLFSLALMFATIGFAVNMILLCPDSPIMYGNSVNPNIEILSHKFVTNSKGSQDSITTDSLTTFANKECNGAKLVTCLGVTNYNPGVTFSAVPRDFRELLQDIPFTDCIGLTAGRCTCYTELLDKCFGESGAIEYYDSSSATSMLSGLFDNSKCITDYQKAAYNVLNKQGNGTLNCKMCTLELTKLPSVLPKLFGQLVNLKDRKDGGPWIMFACVGLVVLFFICELSGRLFSSVGMGFIGRSLPVPFGAYCRYFCFWLLLYIIKLIFEYQVMVKSLVETTIFIWSSKSSDYLVVSQFMLQLTYHNIIYIAFLWIPAIMVILYDAQILYLLLSVVFGSIHGFNLRIGELRSFRILRMTFKSIPKVFNKKLVPNLIEHRDKKKKKKNTKDDRPPERRFQRISYSEGSQPLTVLGQGFSSLLEHDVYHAMAGSPQESQSQSSTASIDSITGVSGAEFERTIPFAMAWNRCLNSMRDADVLSNRELNVLSYLIDSCDVGTANRRLYLPAFLTAGKLDESLDIIAECYAVYEKLRSDKKKGSILKKIETAMKKRILKDDLRVQSICGSYKFATQVIRLLLGREHREMDDCFAFMEECVANNSTMKGLHLSGLYRCRAAAAELMKSILEVPLTTSDTSIKFQRGLYHVIDNVENVLNSLKDVLSKQDRLVKILTETPLKPNSFFFPGDKQTYAHRQLLQLVQDPVAMDIVSRAYQLLTVDNFDAEPRSQEGQRRLRFFANSLFMEMPEAQPVRQMRSLSISTPFLNEIVMYSVKDLTAQNDDCIKLLYYLQTIYPHEWENFLERVGAKDMNEALKKSPEEVQLWASYRGQTLARTVRGMMYNAEAIRFLHWLEIGLNEPMHLNGCRCNRCIRLDDMVALKFSYVCSCQQYGRQKDEQRQQAADIDFLLMKHPGLRVAYVDGPKKVADGEPKYFSVLIRAIADKIVEVYRVELPGDPILGEGKPENQNHAIIFTRGEMLQCIDMNQDGYLEECLKMPNLIATVDRPEHKKNPLTIIGFREYVFTGGVSNLASFMQIQELSFVSQGQRMLALFHVRQHYGHPDIFDKLFAMTTGGTAKASKGINLSEDIFAGFNCTLRGGRVSHEEFIQVGKGRDVGMQQLAQFEAKLSSGAGESVISRDVMRMGRRLDFWRLNSWFYGNLGWYFTQTMTVFGIYFFIYGKIYFALSGLDSFYLQTGRMGISDSLNASWALQFGFLLVVPVLAVVGVERGFRHGVSYLIWNVFTLGPLFFTFQMGNRMHFFDRTLIHGGAQYRATGRGFTIKHEKFAELFRFYAFSHFYRGVEMMFLLILFAIYGTFSWCNCSWTLDRDFYNNVQPSTSDWNARCYSNHYQDCVLPTNQSYAIMSFSLWIVAATWLWAPFFFNPSGIEWDKLIEDYNDWQNWLETKNDSSDSWFGWWMSELEYLEHSTGFARFVQFIRKSRFLLVAIGIYLQLMYRLFYKDLKKQVVQKFDSKKWWEYYEPHMILAGLFIILILLTWIGYCASRYTKKSQMKQKKLRKLKFNMSAACFVILLGSLLYISFKNLVEILMILLIAVYWFVQVMIVRLKFGHVAVNSIARGYDRVVGWIVFGPMLFIAMFMPFLSSFQQRVMFNSAFTSGLEVSKLFGHDVAKVTTTTVTKKVKSKKNRDE